MKSKSNLIAVNQCTLNKLNMAIFVVMFLIAIIPVFAGDNGILSALNETSNTFIDEITNTFNTSIFPILLLANIILIALNSKNEKKLPILTTALKYLLICFIALNCINLVINTLLWVINTLKSRGGVVA